MPPVSFVLAAVHTTGVNWQSIAAIGGLIVTIVGGAAKYITSRIERNRANTTEQIKDIGDNVTDELKGINRRLDAMGERTARLEGRLEATDIATRRRQSMAS